MEAVSLGELEQLDEPARGRIGQDGDAEAQHGSAEDNPVRARESGRACSARERDLREPARAVRVEALRPRERPGEELAGDDREERGEERRRRRRARAARSRRPGSRRRPSRSRPASRPSRAPARRASTTAGSVSSCEAIAQTGKNGSSAATGPCARSVAVSGSAAIRQVSSSLSAISRAVANSTPRPITNIRPTNANGSATSGTAPRAPGSSRRAGPATRRRSSAQRVALTGAVAGEQDQRREGVQVRLRRGDGALRARAEREQRLGRLGQVGADVVRDRDRERAGRARTRDVLDDVRRAARLREPDHDRAGHVQLRAVVDAQRDRVPERGQPRQQAEGIDAERAALSEEPWPTMRTRRAPRSRAPRPRPARTRARARAALRVPAAARGSRPGTARRLPPVGLQPRATTRASPPTNTLSISRLSLSTTTSAGRSTLEPSERRQAEHGGRHGGRGGDRVGELDAERVQVPHRVDHRQHAAGEHAVRAADGAVADDDLEAAEAVGAVGHARAGDRVGDERDPSGGGAPDELRPCRARGGCRR